MARILLLSQKKSDSIVRLYVKIPSRDKYNRQHALQLPPITPHICRHTFCSNMARQGMNPKTLQYIMGHSDIAVTMNVYTHLGLDDAREELVRLKEARNVMKMKGVM